MELLCYSKCTTCKKAEKWLETNSIHVKKRDIKELNPSLEELTDWFHISGLPLKRFFNTSGQAYRTINSDRKVKDMSEDEQLMLLSKDGMLVKRPILVSDNFVLVGFKEEEWKNALLD